MSKNTGTADAAEQARLDGLQARRECLQAALRYERLGLSVLRRGPPDHVGVRLGGNTHNCASPGKVPLPDHGTWKAWQSGRPDEGTLSRWWHDFPTANVGVALGVVSGLVGIDVDGPEGEAELAR